MAASALRIVSSRLSHVRAGNFASGCHSSPRTDKMRNNKVVALSSLAIAVFSVVAELSSVIFVSSLSAIFNCSRPSCNSDRAWSLTPSKSMIRTVQWKSTLFCCLHTLKIWHARRSVGRLFTNSQRPGRRLDFHTIARRHS